MANNKTDNMISKAGGWSKAGLKEVSGFTFLTRGINANKRALENGGGFLKDAFSLFKATANDIETDSNQSYPAESLPLVHRQIYLANAVLMMIMLLSGGIVALISLGTFLVNDSGEAFLIVVKSSPFTFYSSIAVSVLAVVFGVVYGYTVLLHILSLLNCTKPPAELVAQYRASFTSVLGLVTLHSGICFLLQTAPDHIPTRILLGVLTITSSIGIYRSLKRIYSPTLPAILPTPFGLQMLKAMSGKAISRQLPSQQISTPPYVSVVIALATCVASLVTKEVSLISLFSTFISIVGMAVLLATLCVGWYLEDDRSSSH